MHAGKWVSYRTGLRRSKGVFNARVVANTPGAARSEMGRCVLIEPLSPQV